MRRWLLDEGSLTAALRARSNNQFAVEVIAESWSKFAGLTATGLFGPLAPDHEFWSRHVILRGRGQAWVVAHTLLPRHSLYSELSTVLELAQRPLGEFLFSHPQLQRRLVQYTRASEDCWGRRSLFYLFGKPILVAEFFLPALLTG